MRSAAGLMHRLAEPGDGLDRMCHSGRVPSAAMGIVLHPTPYGRPAAERLRARLAAAKADDPLRPVTVVVPTNFVGVSVRRLLAGGELGPVTERGVGVAGLTLLTVYRLAELLGAPRLAAQKRRPVSTPVVAAAVRTVLATQPGLFAGVRDHPSTEEALVRAYRELSELPAASLDRLAATGPRAGDVVRVRRQARARLEGGWFEEADLMAAATDSVRAGSTVLDDVGTVVVYLPQDLSLPAARLLRTVAERAAVEVVAGRTGDAGADADVDRTLRRLGLDPPRPEDLRPPAPTAVVSVSDAEEEARSAVQHLVAAARRGVPLERMAVLYPTAEPYARLVAEQLDAAGVASNGRAVRPLADRLLGRWLLDLLALPDRDYSRPTVMGLVAGAPVRGDDGWRVPAGAWERTSREAGIVRGRREWPAKLGWLAADLRHRADAEAAGEEPREWLVERHRRTADRADGLRAFVDGLCDRLAAAEGMTSWADLAGWCRDMARRYLGGESARERWPEVERAAADRVEEALDRLAGLDAVEERAGLRVFRRTLQLELDDDLGRVGELGAGVLVGTLSAGLGVDLDVVVVLGLAEGVLPSRPREDSLLPDAERRAIGDELRLRTASVGTEHRHLLAALAAAGRERVLVWPRGDLRRSIERAPSRWLLDAAAALGDGDGAGAGTLPATAGWLDTVASFARRVRTAGFPATRQEYGLRALAGVAGRDLLAAPLVAGDPVLRAGAELQLTRGRRGFSRYDGNLGGLADAVASPADPDRVVSPTQLEAWLSCPHAYLLQYVLRVEPVENPEELLEMDPRERGSLVHDVLERWLADQLEAGPPPADEPWPPDARARLLELGGEACTHAERRGVTGHPLLWRRDRARILTDLARFLDEDDERRKARGLVPVAAERPFGIPGSGSAPISIDLGDGRSVRVRGRVDRLDRAADGTLVVADYKTGGFSGYRDLCEERPLGEGHKLQLAVYGAAMRAAERASQVHTEYWFTSTRGDFRRIGYALTDDVVDHLRTALRVAVDGIAAGRFPMRPPEPGWSPFTECRFCDPDDLGTADRYRDWERVRLADELRDYVGYIDPDVLEASR